MSDLFNRGDKVVDIDGYKGYISQRAAGVSGECYEVRFIRPNGSVAGDAIRWAEQLTKV